MSGQVSKIALVSINGKSIKCNPDGTEANVGGYTREPVAADLDPVAGFTKTPAPGNLKFQPIARADFDPIELSNMEEEDITIEYDNGAKFKMGSATCASAGTKGGGDSHWSFEFFGRAWEPL